MRLKILIASVNHEHAATMHINYYHALAEVADVTFFGPGFSTKEELDRGIMHFAESRGGVDAIIYTFPLYLCAIEDFPIRSIYKWNRYFLSYYSIHDAMRYAGEILKELRKMDTLKLVLYGQDYVNISELWDEKLRCLLDEGFYIITWGEDFIAEIEENIDNTFGAGLMVNNLFRRLVCEYRPSVISIPFEAVICSEYYFGSLEERQYDWVVPGNIDGCYPNRSKVQGKVKNAGYKVYDNYSDRTLAYKVDSGRADKCLYEREIERFVDAKLGAGTPYLRNSLAREELVRWRENYNVSLRNSKIAYADGGMAHALVQKYMEIPARGTLLAAEKIYGLEKLGFVDGENMVEITPDNVIEVSAELFRNPDRMRRIAENGQRLVIEKHTSSRRAQDTIKALAAIINKDFQGSYWEDGEFHIIKNHRREIQQ